MLGEEERSSDIGSFSEASIPKRIAIVAAGGLVNIIFGILVYFALVSISGNYISSKIDTVVQNYAAETAGIEVGDKILKIDDKKIRLKSDIDKAIQNAEGKEIKITIERDKQVKDIFLTPTQEKTKNIGIYLGSQNDNLTSEIKGIYEDSAAQKIGLKEGDMIISIDGINVNSDPYKVVELIKKSESEKIQIEVKRENRIILFEVTPEIQTSYKIGVTFALAENNFINNVYYGFWDTVDFSTSMIDNLKMLFTGNIKVEQLTRTYRNI